MCVLNDDKEKVDNVPGIFLERKVCVTVGQYY